MQEPPTPQDDATTSTVPPPTLMPEELPPTLRRLRGDPSQSMHTSTFDPIPYELEAPSMPSMPEVVQPSAHIRAYRKEQLAIATAIITSSFFVSRLLGLLRITIFSSTFGATPPADEFTLAFTLPNAVYNIVAGGALSSAFIPIFTDYMVNRNDRKTAWYISSITFNITGVLLIILGLIGVIFMPAIARLFAFGIFNDPAKHGEIAPVILLSRLMLIQPILLGISVISTSVLQARQRFMLPAIGSVLYNVGLIAGIAATILDNRTHIFGGHLGILGPTWGVIAGAFMQLAIQIPGLIQGKMRYSLSFNFLHPGVVAMFKLMVPRIINSIALYIGAQFVTSALLSSLSPGSVYGYQQAFQLILLPIGIFGMSLSQAAFPSLATFVATGDWNRVRTTVLSAIRIILYLSIPTSLGMIVLAEPITRLLVVHGSFKLSDAPTVYIPLIYFAVGIPAQALIEILVRAYYALKDAATAVAVGITELFFFVGLSILLLQPLGSGGLALAMSIGITGECIALLFILRSRIGGFRIKPLANFIAGVIAASLVATLATLLVYTAIEVVATSLIVPGKTSTIITYLVLFSEIAFSGGIGAIAYWLSAKFLGIESTLPVERIVQRVSRKLRRR
jgi:putative peptidoglycan lipid II flippase